MSSQSQQRPSQDLQSPSTDTPTTGTTAAATGMSGAQNLLGNAAVAGMLPGLGGFGGLIPDLPIPSLPDLGDLIPDFGDLIPDLPTPEIPMPGMPDFSDLLPDMPDLSDLGRPLMPDLGPLIGPVQGGIDTATELWEREGMNAVLDPVGAVDRLNASNELADRFDVVPDDFVGPRQQNQLTQEEYDRVVETYSNIRLGRGDLTLDASELSDEDEAKWRQGSMDDIATMMQTSSGRQMIMTMSDNPMLDDAGNERKFIGGADVTGTWMEGLGASEHHHTTIRPYHQNANNNNRLDDDDAAPLGHDNAVSDDLNPNDGDRSRVMSERLADGSRGAGSDPIIRWNPDNMGPLDVDGDGVRNQTTSDIVLMHEMAHSWHQTQGTLATGQVQATDLDLLAVRQGTPITDLPTLGATNPDVNRARPINRSEHQAAGLGLWGLDTMTENQYREDKAALGQTQPDGNNIPYRPNYATLP